MNLADLYYRFERCLSTFEELAKDAPSTLLTLRAKDKLKGLETCIGEISNELTLLLLNRAFEKKNKDIVIRRGNQAKRTKKVPEKGIEPL